MTSILVTDGEQRAALALVRSLGSAGHRVYVCSARPRSLAGASRYCRAQTAVPDALSRPAEFVTAVEALARRWGVDTLIPISEAALLALLPERERFAGVRIPFPSHERFVRICNKAEVARVAQTLAIRVPAQLSLDGPGERDRAVGHLRFPLVIKPVRSINLAGNRAKTSVLHVEDAAAFDAAVAGLPASAYPLLLQERIVGPGVGVFLLLHAGRVVASFAHRRLREKPPSGGVSVLRASEPLPDDLYQRSVALLRAFDWEGVAMVEYKLDAATGTPYIMEINGRFWGSLQLAVDAGVDFPRLLLEPEAQPGPAPYHLGVTSRWEWGDVDHLLARLRHSPRELALPAGSPGRLRALVDFLAAFGPASRAEVFRWRDPLPFLRESADWLRGR